MSYPTVKLKDISLIKTGKLDSNAAVADGVYPFFTCDPNTLRINDWAYDFLFPRKASLKNVVISKA